MSNVTQILSRIESGDPTATEQPLPLVYDKLTASASGPRSLNQKPNPALHLAVEARHDSVALNEFTLARRRRSKTSAERKR